MEYTQPQLPYAENALEPFISSITIEFHYGKHHVAYINNMNKILESSPLKGKSIEDIIVLSDGALFNNAAQAWNHSFYFESFSPDGGGKPIGKLAEDIDKKWGSFEKFQQEFEKAGMELFGSGWIWLIENKNGELEIMKGKNADNPLKEKNNPLLGFDVWEHAYYLDVQNRRAEHLKGLWNIVNWRKIEQRLKR